MKKSKKLERHIGYWLRLVSNQVSKAFAQALVHHEVSVAEWVVLNLLSGQKLAPAEIASKIGMTRGATSKVLDKLFSKHLIHRSESPMDRRYQDIRLTDRGNKILPKLRKAADENDDHFFGHLFESEKEKLLAFLTTIVSKHKWEYIPID